MPRVRVIGVGGFIKPQGEDNYRPYLRGDEVSVSKEDAERLVNAGVVELTDQRQAANAEEPQPDPGAINLEEGGSTVEELRKFASARRINLGGAQKRAEIVEAIQAQTEPGGA